MQAGSQPDEDVPLPWLERICLAIRRADRTVGAWSFTWWEGGVRLNLPVGAEVIHLDLRRRVEGLALAHTASLTLSLRNHAPLSEPADRVLRVLVRLIQSVDKGHLQVPSRPALIPLEDTEVELSALSPDGARADPGPQATLSWTTVEPDLARRLHECAFLALKAATADDLYPHANALGVPISEGEIQAAWRRTSRAILEGRAPQKLGLYFHIPYCTVECTFCYCAKTEDFTRGDMSTYVDRLCEEVETYAPLLADNTITSVYFGGGTPSLLPPPAMRRLFGLLYDRFRVPAGTQVVFEGNPDSLKPDKVAILAREGRVTRLTIGIQTLDPEVQKYVRRYNKQTDVAAAVKAARDYAIPHVNFDCIAGLEGQSMASFQADLRFLLTLEPDSIHINGFRPLPRTPFGRQARVISREHEALRDEMLDWGHEQLAQSGFVVQLQQDQHRTWDAANLQEYDLRRQNSSLLGLGYPARSHAFGEYFYVRDTSRGMVGSLREQNAGARRYLGCPSPLEEERHKYMVTNIRAGFDREEYRGLFGVDAAEHFAGTLADLQRLGAVEITPTKIRFRTGNMVEARVLRALFYSPAQLARAWEVWGKEYDPSADYLRELEYLIPPAD
jgi:oxygen-independent coproporphyrinogen-3 oxidase